MPRTTGPAADAATPETAADVAPEQPAAGPQPSPRWRYTGTEERIYTNVPVTVTAGDVVAWPEPPADDGWWEPTDEPVNRLPDNHPDRRREV